MWRPRSLIIQAKYGTFAATDLLDEKGEAMRKTLMALAAVATLAVSAVAACPPTRSAVSARSCCRHHRRRHRRRRAGWPRLLLRPGLLLRSRLRLLRRSGLCRRPRLLWRLRLAAAAFLGRLWLAGSPRAGLRLIPFIFVKQPPGNRAFSGEPCEKWPEKTFFSAQSAGGDVYFGLTVVRFPARRPAFESGV